MTTQTICRHPNVQKVLDLVSDRLDAFDPDEAEAKLTITVIIRNGVPRKVFTTPEHQVAF